MTRPKKYYKSKRQNEEDDFKKSIGIKKGLR